VNLDQVYAAAYFASAAISAAIAVAAWRRRPAPGSLGLALLCLGQAEWSGILAVQWAFTDHSPSLFWLAVRNIGLFATPIAILILVADYLGKGEWLERRRVLAVTVVPVVSYLALLTDPWHGLYLGGVEPTMKFTTLAPMFMLNLAYSYALMLLAAAWLTVHLFKRPPYPQQAAVLLLALMLPIAHFALQVAGVDLLPHVNSVPFTFAVSGALEWYALTRLGLFRLIPIARDQLIEQLPEGIILYDADRRIVDINPAAMRMTGATADCLGKTSDEAFPHLADAIVTIRRNLERGVSPSTARATYGGDRVFEATASEMFSRHGERQATLVTLRDVTELLVNERAQRTFVANVAHELQTPLTGLSLLADTIPRALEDDPASARVFVDRLVAEVQRLRSTTAALLSLVRMDDAQGSDPNARADMASIVTEEIATLEPLAVAKRQQVTLDAPESLVVHAEAVDVQTIARNLIANAIQYTGEGGRISVRVTTETHDGESFGLLSIRDNGQGIPADEQDLVFDRFYRVDKARARETGGAGLGLSIVRAAVERSGGFVRVESSLGEGSTFTVTLPLAE